jgi:LysR family glycine cleavage system transcriptional activator
MTDRPLVLPSTAALRAFEVAARHLSFTVAAVELGQTQGAISHQIRELETRLGVKLFDREARGIALTEPGRIYLPYARESLDRLRAGSKALGPQSNDHVLTVSCSPNFASKWLVPRLGEFIDAHPDIDLRISAALQHVTFDRDGIDLAVRHGDGNWPHLNVSRLCRETLIPVCSPHLTPSVDQIKTVHDMAKYVLVHDRDRAAWAQWLEAVGAAVDAFDLNRGPVFSQTSLAIDAAVAGQGIALARSALAGLDLAAGRLIRPVPEEIPATFAYWIVCPNFNTSQPKIQRFRQWLLSQPHLESE